MTGFHAGIGRHSNWHMLSEPSTYRDSIRSSSDEPATREKSPFIARSAWCRDRRRIRLLIRHRRRRMHFHRSLPSWACLLYMWICTSCRTASRSITIVLTNCTKRRAIPTARQSQHSVLCSSGSLPTIVDPGVGDVNVGGRRVICRSLRLGSHRCCA